MDYHMSPERKQELISGIKQYFKKWLESQLPRHPTDFICYDVCDEESEGSSQAQSATPPKLTKPEAPPHHLLKESHPPVSDDDWDILERIFFPKKHQTPTVHDLIEESEEEETFSQALLRIIQEKQLTEPEVYNSVFMDRKLFNKIRNSPEYQPSKRTALLLAVALKLNLDETADFIGKAGFNLAGWNKFDVILRYFIDSGNYNILEINEILAVYKQPLLLRCD